MSLAFAALAVPYSYAIVMYYWCNLFPGYIGIFPFASTRRHHILLTTQEAITNHKDFSKMQRLLVSFDFIHYSYQIGKYWNSMASILNSRTLPHFLKEHSDTPVIR